MAFYSGTSRREYEIRRALDEKSRDPSRKHEIHCREVSGDRFDLVNLTSVRDFAFKRARQDSSEPIVIELTRVEDFERVIKHKSYPLFMGQLTNENHRIYSIEDFVREKFPEFYHQFYLPNKKS